MRKMRLLAVLAAAAMALSACGNGELNKEAMEIGSYNVTAGDLAILTQAQINYSGADFDSSLDTMVTQVEVSFQYGALGEKMGIKLSDEDKDLVTKTRAQYAATAGGLKEYSKYLKENGSSLEFLEELFTASAYAGYVQEKVQEMLGEEAVSDEELKEFYENNYYRAKHILIEKPAEGAEATENQGEDFAKTILERAKAGEDFDAMMKEYSTDPGSESKPDGYVFTDGEMVTEFENGVKALKPGEIGFCESSFGYHIILRLDLSDFEEQKEIVSRTYQNKNFEKKFKELLEEYKIVTTKNQEVIDAITQDMLTPMPTSATNQQTQAN